MYVILGLKSVWAHLGTTSGRKVSVPMLLDVEDLPWPDLQLANSWTFRPAIIGMADDTDRRARTNGSVWAIRSHFRFATSQWLTLRVLPMVSERDACSWVSSLETRVVMDDHATSVMKDRAAIDRMQSFDLDCSQALQYQIFNRRAQQARDVKNVAGNVGNVLFAIRCMGLGDGWSWDDVLALADLQCAKILAVNREIDRSGN